MRKNHIEFSTAEKVGTIKFGEGCVVHPTCSIIAEGGQIIFGKHNIIEERTLIYNKPVKDEDGKIIPKPMIIGDFNLFEIYSHIENSDVGSFNLFECRSKIQDSKIGNGCAIGSDVKVQKKVIPDTQRLFYPGKQKHNQIFNEERHKQIIYDLYDALAEIAPKPRAPTTS